MSSLHVIWGLKWPEVSIGTYFSLSGGSQLHPLPLFPVLVPLELLAYGVPAIDLSFQHPHFALWGCVLCGSVYAVYSSSSGSFLVPYSGPLNKIHPILTKSQPLLTNFQEQYCGSISLSSKLLHHFYHLCLHPQPLHTFLCLPETET